MSEAPLLVAVSGSPRDGSDSRALLMIAVEAASEQGLDTALLDVRRLRIAPCEGCEACARGPCVIEDDMTDVLELLKRADAVIVASPIYFSGPTAQLKALIDRCQPAWHDKVDRRDAPGGMILVGGSREPIFRNAESEIASMLAVLGFDPSERLLVPATDVSVDATVRSRASDLGRAIARRTLGRRRRP